MGDSGYWSGMGRSRPSRRAVLRGGAVGAAGLAGAALIGCAGGGGGGAPTAVATAAQGTPTAVASYAAQAKRGGTLRIAGQLTGDVPGLDYDRVGGSAMGSIANITG
ncbi:MAG: hypothetical protein AB7G21_05990, partial [Dehalococcoidia bacterium]